MLPMDLSLILSFLAVAISIITLWLTELRGPDISLSNTPEFKLTDEYSKSEITQLIRNYTPQWLKFNPVPFAFSNYGGKAGSILDLQLVFVPNNSFRSFFDSFYAPLVRYEGDISPPVTIEEGDNQHLNASPEIRTIKWKETTLAEALNPNLKVDDIVEKALERSKEKFQSFCDFLESSRELGKVSCIATLTQGRFRTKVANKVIFKNVTVTNKYDRVISLFRNCLPKWEHLSSTKVELRNKLVRDIEGLKGELNENLSALAESLNENYISQKGAAIRLRVDKWNKLQHIRTQHERKIRWFLIESEEGLKEELIELYRNIAEYNSSCDELMSLGELRTTNHFEPINAEREKLQAKMKEIHGNLSQLLRHCIS